MIQECTHCGKETTVIAFEGEDAQTIYLCDECLSASEPTHSEEPKPEAQ